MMPLQLFQIHSLELKMQKYWILNIFAILLAIGTVTSGIEGKFEKKKKKDIQNYLFINKIVSSNI